MSVAVIDIDWHLMDVPEEFGTAWTGYTYATPTVIVMYRNVTHKKSEADVHVQLEREALPRPRQVPRRASRPKAQIVAQHAPRRRCAGFRKGLRGHVQVTRT